MRGKNFIIKKIEATVLFNGLVQSGYERNLQVILPMMNNLEIFKLRLKGEHVELDNLVEHNKYNKIYKQLINRLKERAKREIPDYENFKQTLYQSGIVQPRGLNKFLDEMNLLKKRDILQGGDVYYIALDTNMLRDRFFSLYLKNLKPHPNIDYILCETVRDELKNRRDKISQNQLKDLHSINYHLLEKMFLNQNCLEDRLRYVGFLEYNRMRSKTSCEEIDSPSSKRSGMENDQIILGTYSDFVDVGRKVIYLSRDNETVRMMSGEENVISMVVEHPPVFQNDFNVKWDNLIDFIYYVSILFGRITIMFGGIEVCSLNGVWRGKDFKEWEEDMMLLEIFKPRGEDVQEKEDYEFLINFVERNLGILKKLSI